MKKKILKIADDLRDDKITAYKAEYLLLCLLGANTKSSKPELKKGYIKIKGYESASSFEKICKESEMLEVGKKIFNDHPGEDGYYTFTKFLWVIYPDNRYDCRLDDIVPYD